MLMMMMLLMLMIMMMIMNERGKEITERPGRRSSGFVTGACNNISRTFHLLIESFTVNFENTKSDKTVKRLVFLTGRFCTQ